MEKTKRKIQWKYYINYIAVSAFLLAMVSLNAGGMLSRSYVSLLTKIAYSIILAVSLNLVVGFLGELSLGHAGFMCIGAYIGCFVSIELHKYISNDIIVLVLSMLAGGLLAAVMGFVIGLPALRLKGDYLAIVTLAFGEIVRNIFKNLKVFGGAMGYNTITFKPGVLYIVAFIVVLITLALCQNLIRSKHGRAITAIRDNEIAAKAMGINVTYYKLFVFVISAFFAGIAGTIYGHWTTPVLYSAFDFNYSIEILVMVVLGGIGSVNGSIIAATMITYVNFLLQSNLSGNLAAIRPMVYALILIIVVLFNNAPAFLSLREKFGLRSIIERRREHRAKPEQISDDSAKWDRITTKITMDEVLSVDVTPGKNAESDGEGEQ